MKSLLNMKSSWLVRLGGTFLLAVLAGIGVAWFSPGSFFSGWLGATLLLWACLYLLWEAWQLAGGGKVLAVLVITAFFLRLGVGIGLHEGLVHAGYADPQQIEGYFYNDSYRRDMESWSLAASSQPLVSGFKQEFVSDQYGGLLTLSAAVYRFVSPDAHRSTLILILTSFAAAVAVPFMMMAIRKRWNMKIAVLAAWIYVLYPDSILLGATQMREPFYMGLIAIAFWAVIYWHDLKWKTWLPLIASLIGLALLSYRVALPVAGVLALWFWLENVAPRLSKGWRMVGWIIIGLVSAAALLWTWNWLETSSSWDQLVTVRASGMIRYILKQFSRKARPVFTLIYGITQPVLPAAIFEPSLLFWKVVAIFRAVGWYLLLPLLIYGSWASIKTTPRREQKALSFVALIVLAWTLISALRAGGDQWDNPRYRMIFILWFALLAAWGWYHARESRDPWLWRWVGVEVVFLGFFTVWYYIRYYPGLQQMSFFSMVGWIIGLSVLVILGGWLWDRRKHRSRLQ